MMGRNKRRDWIGMEEEYGKKMTGKRREEYSIIYNIIVMYSIIMYKI
jgi:hypothetical protein